MEVVRDFNNELSSLYEVRPPISKAKMMQITKSAIKGIKFYKHIVQSVEKFILKCKPEYKVPGLYVIDSIVRQSRHQFGAEKEVFAPRFMKNIMTTFQNLFRCADDDRPKIVRVLNLWQKNSVFPSDVIQPLMDMANPNSAGEYASFDNPPAPLNESPVRKAEPPSRAPNESTPNSKHKSSESWKGWPQGHEEAPPPPDSHNYSEMSTKNLEKFTKANSGVIETSNTAPTTKNAELKTQEENTIKFNKKLLDFDYGDEEDEEEMKGDDGQTSLAYSISQNLLSNPELLRQLQQMQQTIQQNESLKSEPGMQSQPVVQKENRDPYSPVVPDCKIPTTTYMDMQPPLPQQPNLMFPYDNNTMGYPPPLPPHLPILPPDQKLPMDVSYPMLTQENLMIQSSQVDEDDRMIYSMPGEPPLPPQDLDERALIIPGDDRIKKERSRSRSGSRGRGSIPGQQAHPPTDLDERAILLPDDLPIKKSHSRSRLDSNHQGRSGRHRSRSRSPRRRKSRSRSRSRSRRNRSRSKERDRERRKEREREKDRERDRVKKGIPPARKNFVSVCSTTLWLGHVPKTLSEEDIASTYADFGSISSIDMIPPRGCAYVVMDRRQDAHRALQKLKNLKLQGSSIKMAWAPGKGTKGKEYKDYWEVDTGVTYIPFEKLPNDLGALDSLGEGGFIDEESLPPHLREMKQQRDNAKHATNDVQAPAVGEKHGDKNGLISQPPPMQAAMLPPNLGSLPMVLPQMMQTQFGMPLPGLMPPQPMVVQHMPMPVGVPPPNPLMMVQPPSQNLLSGTPLPLGAVPQMPHLSMPHHSLSAVTLSMSHMTSVATNVSSESVKNTLTAGDATPTDEDGTRVSSPPATMQVMTSSVSAAPIVSHGGLAQFNSAMGLHGASRPLLPGLPPSSTSGSLPFPPPHVGFAFPPPGLRPTMPPQTMPVVSLSSAFPWQKQPPNFAGFPDPDSRYSTGAPGNSRPVSQQQGKVNTGNQSSNRSGQGSGDSSLISKESPNQPGGINEKDRGQRTDHMNNDGFSSRGNMPPKMFNRPASPEPYDMEIDQEDQHDIFPGGREEFPRDHRAPHFPGPPDFHPAHGGMRDRWMPGPRFPRGGMHGGLPFPPRGPRGAFPRMEMDFFPPQGPPPGPRMHGPGVLGFSPRRGGGNFPPRGPDRFSNHGDFYNEPPHFEEGERNKMQSSREDWGQHRREWEEPSRRNEDEESRRPHYERERSEQKDQPKSEESPTKAPVGESEPKATKSESSVPSEAKLGASVSVDVPKGKSKMKQKAKGQSSNLFNDMFRLQNYSKRTKKGPLTGIDQPVQKVKPPSVTKKDVNKDINKDVDKDVNKDVDKDVNKDVDKDVNKDVNKDVDRDVDKDIKEASTSEKTEETEIKLETQELNSGELQKDSRNSEGSNLPNEGTQDIPNKKERDRKRSSRWGRTLSEEREFQQQKINEANVNGSTETNNLQVETISTVSNIDSCGGESNPTTCDSDVTSSANVADNTTEISSNSTEISSNPTEPLASQEPACVANNVNLEIVENDVTTEPLDSTAQVAS